MPHLTNVSLQGQNHHWLGNSVNDSKNTAAKNKGPVSRSKHATICQLFTSLFQVVWILFEDVKLGTDLQVWFDVQTFGVDFDAMHFWFDRSSRIKARTAQTMADMYLSLDIIRLSTKRMISLAMIHSPKQWSHSWNILKQLELDVGVLNL